MQLVIYSMQKIHFKLRTSIKAQKTNKQNIKNISLDQLMIFKSLIGNKYQKNRKSSKKINLYLDKRFKLEMLKI